MMVHWQKIESQARPAYVRFCDAASKPLLTQQGLIKEILKSNARCAFGKRHGFEAMTSVEEYLAKVPVQDFDSLRSYIDRMALGEHGQLSEEPVLLFEETGGSRSGSKLIPYSAPALESFRAALLPWLADTIASRPNIKDGTAYWAISPAVQSQKETSAGIPIGDGSDAIYLGADLAPSFMELSAVGENVRLAKEYDTWRYLTALSLLKAEDLSLISVWSPTFLFPILETILVHADQLMRDLREGRVRHPERMTPLPGDEIADSDPGRARVIERSIQSREFNTEEAWPRLDTLSCWTHGPSETFARQLEGLFPHVHIQGKGLLATEGAITLPLERYPYPVLALQSGFFEFFDEQGESHLCDDLDKEAIYKVIMTTPGGLYRYDLGDKVKMKGWAEAGLPMLEFVGRSAETVDLVGEKLTSEFVETCLQQVGGFRMIFPQKGESPPRYALVVDEHDRPLHCLEALGQEVEQLLCANPQYQYARNVGQLGPLSILPVDRPLEKYLESGRARGQSVGDIKFSSLQAQAEWLAPFGKTQMNGGRSSCGLS